MSLLRRIATAILTEGFRRDPLMRIGVLFLVLNLLIALGLVLTSHNGVDYKHRALGTDFITFWTASWMVLHGDAGSIYDIPKVTRLVNQLLPGHEGVLFWLYPPTFLVPVVPLALLPYLPSLFVFTALGLGLCCLALRHWPDRKLHLLLFLAAPATLLNLLQGQNGFFTAGLWVAGLALLPKRPVLAGALLGLLVFKPQLAVLAPFVLLLSGNWRGLCGFAVSAGLFVLASLLVSGPDMWQQFFSLSGFSFSLVSEGLILPWSKMGSLFVSARMLGLPPLPALLLHGLGAVVALVAVAGIWRSPSAPQGLKSAAVLLAALIVTPHQFDYDLVLLLGALAFWHEGLKGEWKPEEKLVAALLWFGPLFTTPLAGATNLGLLPLLLLAALWNLSKKAEPIR
jgi:hypothetical protein